MGFMAGFMLPGTAAVLIAAGALVYMGKKRRRKAYYVASAALVTVLTGMYLLFMRFIACM
ncbi:MAG: hypothetical protein IKE57_07065 [Oscillospiraceae bacterium]|nr:hypothetical protein [Oscillospiraceae bacterium]